MIDVLLERLRQRVKIRQRSVARLAGRRIQSGERQRYGCIVAGMNALPQTAKLQRHVIVDLPQQREASTALSYVVLISHAGMRVVHIARRLLLEVAAP